MKSSSRQIIYQFPCSQVHFFRDKNYTALVYTTTVNIADCKDSQFKPVYQIKISLNHHIHFQFNEKNSNEIISFSCQSFEKQLVFKARSEHLFQLRQIVAGRIMFQNISDFYTPLKEIGIGSSSKVFLVEEKRTKEKLACKSIDKKYLQNDGGHVIPFISKFIQQAFVLEINNMVSLTHQGILQVYEVFEGTSTYYIIMEYLGGKSLDYHIKKNQLTFKQITVILKNLLQVVEYMHSQNIMHRDLKPENIMFKDNYSTLKIVDFGLSTKQDVERYIYPKCGTPGYVAPEIANLVDLEVKYDKICDLFSVGVILYNMVTQQDLFQGDDYYEVFRKNQKCIIHFDLLESMMLPIQLIDLLKKLLEPNPTFRINATQALNHCFFDLSNNFEESFERKQKFSKISNYLMKPLGYPMNLKKEDEEDCNIEDDDGKLPQIPIFQKFHFKEFLIMKKHLRIQGNQAKKRRQNKNYSTNQWDDCINVEEDVTPMNLNKVRCFSPFLENLKPSI